MFGKRCLSAVLVQCAIFIPEVKRVAWYEVGQKMLPVCYLALLHLPFMRGDHHGPSVYTAINCWDVSLYTFRLFGPYRVREWFVENGRVLWTIGHLHARANILVMITLGE